MSVKRMANHLGPRALLPSDPPSVAAVELRRHAPALDFGKLAEGMRRQMPAKPKPDPSPFVTPAVVDRETPSSPPPIMVDEDQLQPLGTLRGNPWFTLAAAPESEYELLRDAFAIPDRGPVRLEDGQCYVAAWMEDTADPVTGTVPPRYLVWQPTRRHAAGAFANGGRAPVADTKPRKTKPLAAVDGLGTIPALARREQRILAIGKPREEPVAPLAYGAEPIALPQHRPPADRFVEGRGTVRGARDVLAIVKRQAGASLGPCRYACHVVTYTPGGALPEAGRELVDRTAPFLAPHVGVTRSPLADIAANAYCHHPDHAEDDQPDAVTIGPGGIYGAPLCAEHVR